MCRPKDGPGQPVLGRRTKPIGVPSEPHLPSWSTIANNIFAVELGKMTTGGYKTAKECADQMAALANKEVGIYT